MNRNPSRLSWRQFLSYHANIAPVRVLFNCPEIEHRAMLSQRRVRAEVYADNHPELQGRAVFWVGVPSRAASWDVERDLHAALDSLSPLY